VDDIKINKSVKCTSINQVQKDISTMYLSLKDKTTLTSLLHLFKNNKKEFNKEQQQLINERKTNVN
jgi:hypothetical protein